MYSIVISRKTIEWRLLGSSIGRQTWPRWLKSVVKIKVNPKLYIPTKDIIKVMLGPFNYSFVVQWKDSTK